MASLIFSHAKYPKTPTPHNIIMLFSNYLATMCMHIALSVHRLLDLDFLMICWIKMVAAQ